MAPQYGYLVIGAGMAGAAAARALADAGKTVLVLERRDHVGGNAYDRVERMTGDQVNVDNFTALNLILGDLKNNTDDIDPKITAAMEALTVSDPIPEPPVKARDRFEALVKASDAAGNDNYYGPVVDALGRVDALMDLTSELQTAIEDLKGDAGLTKGEGEKFYEALVNINQAYQTLRDAKTLRDPYLADVAFYTVIRDTIAAGD